MSTNKEPRIIDHVPEALRAQLRQEILAEIEEGKKQQESTLSPMFQDWLKNKKEREEIEKKHK